MERNSARALISRAVRQVVLKELYGWTLYARVTVGCLFFPPATSESSMFNESSIPRIVWKSDRYAAKYASRLLLCESKLPIGDS